MANLPETPVFTADIYQIETTDRVLGGPDGVVNLQAKQIADRTAYLKQEVEAAAGIAVDAETKADSALLQIASAEAAMGSAAASAAAALLHKNDALAAKALAEQARSDAQAAAVDASAAATGAAADRVTAGQRAAEAQASATSAVNAASFVQADRVAAQTARNEAVAAQSAAEAAAVAADADRVDAQAAAAAADTDRIAAEAARTGAEAAQAAVYGDLASSAAGKGAELVEYRGATVEAALNERLPEIGNYAGLDAYTGDATAVMVYGVQNIFDGGAGVFRRTTDTPTAANGIYRKDALNRWWKRDFSGRYNILWFGADKTGGTDAAGIINSVITFVGTNGGGEVYAPTGKYLLNSSILLNEDSVFLVGDGYGENAAAPITTFIKNFNGTGILVSDRARGGQHLRWKVKGIKLNGNNKTGDGIFVDDAHYGSIEDVYVHNNITDGNGIHFNYAYSNTLRNVQSVSNYRNYKFENQSHDIIGTKCYSSNSTAEGFYITTSNALSFYGSTHEGSGTIGIRVNRLTKGVVFDGVYIEVNGSGYTSCIRVSEETSAAYSVRNTAIKNVHIRINGTYTIPVLVRSGVLGCVVENVNVEYNSLTIDGNSRAVFLGWSAGAVAVDGVRVSNVHADLVSCTGTGIQVVSAQANVVDGGAEAVGCTCYGDTLRMGLSGKHHSRNSGAVDGNHLAPVDFAALKLRTSAPTYILNQSIVYADGATWNPSGTGEGLHIVRSGGTYKRIVEHNSSTTAARPTTGLYIGMQVFDTTLGKPIWWNGTVWKDAAGTTV